MSHLVRLRQVQFDSAVDLLRSVSSKIATGELGKSPEEILAAATKELNKGASTLESRLEKFVTSDPAMTKVKDRIRILHKYSDPVLITGPTGTGKELLARALAIPGAPFVAENCGALPENLVESIFFGHVKGAFTGAHENHTGLLEQAGEGIIFLDEIGDMNLSLQAKFLRAIQENEIRRVGGIETIELGCRFVAATKYDLEERVEKGTFREDLYARLFTYSVKVTGLIERPNDIPVITRSMLGNPDSFPDLPPFEQRHIDMIFKYNVRAIEAMLARHRAYESYD